MSSILQGTTPTLVLTIPSSIPVANITALELALKHKTTVTLLHLSDVTVDSNENTIAIVFTEAQTLALDPQSPLFWQLRVQTGAGIFGTDQSRIEVKDLISTEVME